jgi:hypothetical protein
VEKHETVAEAESFAECVAAFRWMKCLDVDAAAPDFDMVNPARA